MLPDITNPRGEPVALAWLVTIITWLAAYVGLKMDPVVATALAGVVMTVAQYVARMKVTPVDKANAKIAEAGANPPGTLLPKL